MDSAMQWARPGLGLVLDLRQGCANDVLCVGWAGICGSPATMFAGAEVRLGGGRAPAAL